MDLYNVYNTCLNIYILKLKRTCCSYLYKLTLNLKKEWHVHSTAVLFKPLADQGWIRYPYFSK